MPLLPPCGLRSPLAFLPPSLPGFAMGHRDVQEPIEAHVRQPVEQAVPSRLHACRRFGIQE
ncbi:hypothetical protein ZEAMMB73_Zm00001d005172 [Zea mays]|uniref:Uncharacterized protein n=1 Tax=Zea mays TaxID=4577 RepID=A0A1D6EKX2_MAIZE|nr:hypothetical protein ZEAMMB73_Zm00001d005172 [Zea mays]